MEWLGWLPLVLPGRPFVGLTAYLQTDYKVITGLRVVNGPMGCENGTSPDPWMSAENEFCAARTRSPENLGFSRAGRLREVDRRRTVPRGPQATGICDCAGCAAISSSGGGSSPRRPPLHPTVGRRFVACERLLSDGSASVADRMRSVLEAWRELGPEKILFENAENLRSSPSIHALFAQLLASMPPERSVVICTREPLRTHLTRFAAPHEIVALRAADLAFDAAEVREIFHRMPSIPRRSKACSLHRAAGRLPFCCCAGSSRKAASRRC